MVCSAARSQVVLSAAISGLGSKPRSGFVLARKCQEKKANAADRSSKAMNLRASVALMNPKFAGSAVWVAVMAWLIAGTNPCPAAAAPDQRPGLLFREDWKESPAATPVTQEHVSNPDLILARHGPGEAQVKK